MPGIYKDTLSDRLALTADGKLGAVIKETKQVLLFRTDGGTFGTTAASAVDISPAATLNVSGIKPSSLTFAGGQLYCVGQVTAGADLLLRAPQDGSKPLDKLTLPKVGGADPAHISDGLAVSADGSVIAVLAGPGASQRDLVAVSAASGAATNLTQGPAQIAERGAKLGQLEAQLALSAKGSLAAYVVANQELYVVKTDGSAKPFQVTDQKRFKIDVVVQINLLFSDDDDLLWMAGTDINKLDLYRHDGATGQVFNLTGHGFHHPPLRRRGRAAAAGALAQPQREVGLLGRVPAGQGGHGPARPGAGHVQGPRHHVRQGGAGERGHVRGLPGQRQALLRRGAGSQEEQPRDSGSTTATTAPSRPSSSPP